MFRLYSQPEICRSPQVFLPAKDGNLDRNLKKYIVFFLMLAQYSIGITDKLNTEDVLFIPAFRSIYCFFHVYPHALWLDSIFRTCSWGQRGNWGSWPDSVQAHWLRTHPCFREWGRGPQRWGGTEPWASSSGKAGTHFPAKNPNFTSRLGHFQSSGCDSASLWAIAPLPRGWMARRQIQNGSHCPAVPDTISHLGAAAVYVM